MKRCHSAGVSWTLALIKFLAIPGLDRKSPSELLSGCQFRSILPALGPKVNEKDSDLFSEWKQKEKMKFGMKSKQLQELFIGSNVSYLNADLKSWSIGKVHARSQDGHSYQVFTENGNLISRNHVHLRPTGVEPSNKSVRPCIPNVKADKPIITPSREPTPTNATKVHKVSTQNTAKSNDDLYRTWSGRVVCRPPHYRD